MKRIFVVTLIVFVAASSLFAQREDKNKSEVVSGNRQAEMITKAERDSAVEYLKKTREKFLASIKGLSEAQWNFKPAPDKWSVAEVAEHIGIAEQTIFGQVTEIVKSPAEPELKAEAKGKDEIILKVIPDRSAGKAQSPEILKPIGRWANEEALIKDFEKNRAQTIAYTKETKDDLRNHFAPHPVLKTLDAYQWLLFLAAHSERHTAQILEVKADVNFPKK